MRKPSKWQDNGVLLSYVVVLDMELTMAGKRDLIERITELVKNDILNKEYRDDIFRVCLAACSRELAKLNDAE